MNEVKQQSALHRVLRMLDEHPLVLVAIIGAAFTAFQWWWISNARFFGALDVDESGSIATSLRFHRALMGGPLELARAAFGTGDGPLVPILSIPFVAVFGRSAISPMFVQPVLVLLSAIGVSGAVNQLVGRRAAVIAGCCTLAMPALIISSRTDQFSNGVGAAMCLALWALLASDRGRRLWPVLGFGAACGAMTISRTMSISFIPAMCVAALFVAALSERRVQRNLLLGSILGLAIAVPWWWAQWDYVSAYLLSSGYGTRSNFFGQEHIIGRAADHFGYLLRDFRVFLSLGTFLASLSAMEGIRRARPDPRAWISNNRELIAVWVAIVLGTLALLSSSNRGIWFATPLDSLLVIGVVASGTRLLRSGEPSFRVIPVAVAVVAAAWVTFVGWVATGVGIVLGMGALAAAISIVLVGRSRRAPAMGAVALGLGAAVLAASFPFVGPSGSISDNSTRGQLVGGLEPLLPTIYVADTRLSSPDMRTRRRVAGQWAAAAQQLDRRLLSLEDTMSIDGTGTLAEVVTGSRGLFSNNIVAIARELGPRGVRWLEHPNTFETSDSEIQDSIAPTAGDGTPRIIVAIEGRSAPFPDSLGWHRLVRLAEQHGWELHSAVPLPDRGRVALYVHPDNLGSG